MINENDASILVGSTRPSSDLVTAYGILWM